MRSHLVTSLACALTLGAAGCGSDSDETPGTFGDSGSWPDASPTDSRSDATDGSSPHDGPAPDGPTADSPTPPDGPAPDGPIADAASDGPQPEQLVVTTYLPDERAREIVQSCPASRVYRIPVLSIRYFPVVGDQLDSNATGINMSLADMRKKVDLLNKQVAQTLEIGSTYHPEQDAAASCSLDYEIIDDVEYLEALPPGKSPPDNPAVFFADYNAILNRENICNLVSTQGVKQVWLWGYHHGTIVPAESNMAGPHGDISNSYRFPDDMPICGSTYVLFNYNYDRGAAEAVEDHGHQLEAIFSDLDSTLFSLYTDPHSLTAGQRNSCGNVHYPPNGASDYDWHNATVVSSDCDSWTPLHTGPVTQVSCSNWTCNDDGGLSYKAWWMTHMPGKGNTLTHQGNAVRNWWEAVADFDAVKSANTGLVH